jgi:hypothetical protein
MTNTGNTFLILGCLLIDLIIGMVFVFGLHKLFPKVGVTRLAYLAAGMFSISSAIYGNPSSFLNFLLMTIIGTAIWGTIYLGLWRLISFIFKKKASVQDSD